jgi:hypothetical protein
MATPFSTIYSKFLPKITDYSFLNMSQETLEGQLQSYLSSSVVKFRYCDKIAYQNNTLKQFDKDLTEEETEILALLMCVEFLTPKILTDDLLRQRLSSKDYNLTSQANHIKEVREIRNTFKREADNLMTLYTYKKTKMDEFK